MSHVRDKKLKVFTISNGVNWRYILSSAHFVLCIDEWEQMVYVCKTMQWRSYYGGHSYHALVILALFVLSKDAYSHQFTLFYVWMNGNQ